MRGGMKEGIIPHNRSKAMQPRRLVTRGLLVVGLIAVTGFGAQLTLTAIADGAPGTPSAGRVAFAQRTSDLLLATLFAALTQEFDETTPNNVEEGKRSISLVFK